VAVQNSPVMSPSEASYTSGYASGCASGRASGSGGNKARDSMKWNPNVQRDY